MTQRQTVISILGLFVIAACIVVAMMYPPLAGQRTHLEAYAAAQRGLGPPPDLRSAVLQNAMYLAAAGTAVLAVILALSPWGRSKD